MNDIPFRPELEVIKNEAMAAHESLAPLTPPAGLGEVSVGASFEDQITDVVADPAIPHPDSIPSLLPLLDSITSVHPHKYDDSDTVRTKAKEAESLEAHLYTPEQKQLLEDREVMKSFTYSTLHEFVLTPQELHGLASRLKLLSGKNRPDFNEVESEVLDIIIAETARDWDGVPAKIRGAAKRAEKDVPDRRGMQWATLTEFSRFASDVIRSRMEKGEDREDYLITVRDPDHKTNPDLTAVYQFVADVNTYEIFGCRSAKAQGAQRATFIANCQVINDWYAEVSPILATIPYSVKLDRFSATTQIKAYVETMNARLESDQSYGAKKSYRFDPAGAINLQKRIGHSVETIKAELLAILEPQTDEGKIVPLDFDI